MPSPFVVVGAEGKIPNIQAKAHLLIVDDDEALRKILSSILQSEGYEITSASTAKEAIENAKTQFFEIALLDINLPDMEGVQLLSQLQEITPKTVKIIITGYPSLENAVDALNIGADSYIIKPVDPDSLLETIKNKLVSQWQKEEVPKERYIKWTKSLANKVQTPHFQELLEATAMAFKDLGLTTTQAKIYTTLVALGSASPTEITALSKVRREEVYRMIHRLENIGIVTRKLHAPPRTFLAASPEEAIGILTKAKLDIIKEEVDKLRRRGPELASRLELIEAPAKKESSSVEVISQMDVVFEKSVAMAEKAKRQIAAIFSLRDLKRAYVNSLMDLRWKLTKRIKIQVVTERHEPDSLTEEIVQHTEANKARIELREIQTLPFYIFIVDDNEAIWGEQLSIGKNALWLWTNNATQIVILKTCFESLWQSAQDVDA